MNTVVINGSEYTVPEMDFDTICTFEENGISLMSMDANNMKVASVLRAFVAWVMGVSPKRASQEISAHMMNGGDLTELVNAFSAAIEDSGFFNANRQTISPADHQKKQPTKSGTRKNTNA